MAPRPRPIGRKASVSGSTLATVRTNAEKPAELPVAKAAAAGLMPPPPNPIPVYGVLEREVKALETILKVASAHIICGMTTVTGSIECNSESGATLRVSRRLRSSVSQCNICYIIDVNASYSKLGHDAPNPPRSLIQSFGQEVERYDQLCDMIEAQLVSFISHLCHLGSLRHSSAQ